MSDPPTANTLRYNMRKRGATSMSACVSPSLSRTPANPVTSNQTDNHRPKKRRYGAFNQLSNDPDRRIFSDKLIMCHIERGTPIIECPTISQKLLDLYEVYLAVKERGGFFEVTRGEMWSEIAGLIGIRSFSKSFSKKALYLRGQYFKYLLPFECKYDGVDPGGILASSRPSIPWGEADEVHPMPAFDYTVLQDFRNLLLTGEGCDVIMQVKDQQFKAHRSILIARSSVFAAMFGHDMKEKATGMVNVEDCDSSSFPVFLDYLYCGSTEKLSSENVFNLYVSADKYNVKGLKRKCLEFMKSNLTVDTIYETLQIAIQHSDTDLLNFATEFFIRNFLLIIPTTKWETFLSENPKEGDRLFKKIEETYKLKAC